MKRRAVLLEPLSNMMDSASLGKHENVVIMFSSYGRDASPSVYETAEFQIAVRAWLKDNEYDPMNDLFVVTGRTTKVAVALATIKEVYAGIPLPVMIFNGQTNEYVERQI